ncbi:hypothetical protein SERLA73DRAFT_183354 [Serpula lacrymans var. lacrymans S7.3]|uniref:rRNA biogenesis protein RRP36 n=1 Tax=Serpula lacrymans var. lacrymans (strain S7.3) TaxID=936435 RepID=F8PZR0_SERL3|nr:hypothetical protein SERLA73DRAFT_183354 [Serpula lacrymans var. lacrymans S7.3]
MASYNQDDSDVDSDAPRVAQWVDEDELDNWEDESDEDDEDEEIQEDGVSVAGPSMSRSQQRELEDDLSTIPLGMLRKAQRALSQTQALEDSSSEDDSDGPPSEGGIAETSQFSKSRDKPDQDVPKRSRKDVAKRANKHAPMEVTSKRPVTRRRTVVAVQTAQPRDPRFLPLTGELKPHKFRQQYGFLSDLHSSELKTLRETLKRSRKLLENCPKDLRAERQAEVQRLELTVKRAESSVNRDKREKVEAEALHKVSKEEREKRKQGKAGWWMKQSDKKELLTKARYEAIAADGGKRAVKKAIEKKQKKIGQKEKKSRPFPRGGAAESASHQSSDSLKRPRRFSSSNEQSKRRKIG